jgi:hypothetical protein
MPTNNLTEAQNEAIYSWVGKMLKKELPASQSDAGIEHSRGSRSFNLGRSYRRDRSTGAVNKVGITMKQHGIYREKGVGKGRGKDSDKRINRPWFNPAIDRNIDELADNIATISGDIIAGSLKIK